MWYMAFGGALTGQALVVLTTLLVTPNLKFKGFKLFLVHLFGLLGVIILFYSLYKVKKIVLNPYLQLTEALVLASEGDLEIYLSHTPEYEPLRAFSSFNLLLTKIAKSIYKVSLLLKSYEESLTKIKPIITDNEDLLRTSQSKIQESMRISSTLVKRLGETRALIENIFLENQEFYNRFKEQIEELSTLTDNNTIVALNAQIEASHSEGETSETFHLIAGDLQEMSKQSYQLVNSINEDLKAFQQNLDELKQADEEIKNILHDASQIPENFQQSAEITNQLMELSNKLKNMSNRFQNISYLVHQILQEYRDTS